MSKKADLFRAEFALGTAVEIYLPTGERVSGVLVEVDEARLTLESLDHRRTLFFDVLAGWTRVKLDSSVQTEIPAAVEAPVNNPPVEVPVDSPLLKPSTYSSDNVPVEKSAQLVKTGEWDPSPHLNTEKAPINHTDSVTFEASKPDPRFFEIFRREVNIPIPPPVFEITELDSDERMDLNRLKNKYDYAIKIKEFSRIRPLVQEALRLAEHTRRSELFELGGLLALQVELPDTALSAFRKCNFEINSKFLLGLAHICVTKKDWQGCATYLISAIRTAKASQLPHRPLLECLGQAIGLAEFAEIPGLAALVDCVDLEAKPLAKLVLAFALFKNKPAAALAVLHENLDAGQRLAGDSLVFKPFQESKPETIPQKPQREEIPKTPTVRFGRVSAVFIRGGSYFGFIRDDVFGGTYYFDFEHTADAELAKQLISDRCGQRVQFSTDFVVMPGQKHPKASDVQMAQHSSPAPTDLPPRSSPRKIAPAVLRRAGYYGEAKFAEQVGNLSEAERLYEKAICQAGRYRPSAVMDLASLIHRKGRTAEAVALMDHFATFVQNPIAVVNQKIAFWIAAKEFEKAECIINSQIPNSNPMQRLGLQRQLVFCHFGLGHYGEALKVLRALPQDTASLRMIGRIEQAQRDGIPSQPREDAVSREFSQWTSGLSPFARYLLENVDGRYIDERSKARGYYDEQDFKMLEKLFDGVRGRRPAEKGRILLTIASLCQTAPEAAGERQVGFFLRRSLHLMGQAAFIDSMNPDIARTFFTEAASMSSEREVMLPLAQLLATYLTEKPAVGSLERDDGMVFLADVLTLAVLDQDGWARFEADFVYFSVMSVAITRVLQRQIQRHNVPLRRHLAEQRLLEIDRNQELERLRREQEELGALESLDYRRAESFVTAAKQLYNTGQQSRFQTDRRRATTLGNICTDCAGYSNEQDYVEREGKYLRLSQGLARFREEITGEPTKLSVELLLPIVDAVANACREDFDLFTAKARVTLSVSNVLHNDYYIPDNNGCLRVCLAVESASGGAPIEGLEVTAREEAGLDVVDSAVSPEILRGGQRREVEVLVRPTSSQLNDKAFSLDCLVRYKNRAGEAVEIGGFGIPVRIGASADFHEVSNPYRNYAGGRSVDEPSMFKGRDDLLSRIVQVVTSQKRGQCFVLYGQKRSGKTSILRQLKHRLTPPFLAVDVTIGALEINNKDASNFMELCIDQLRESIATVGVMPDKVDDWPCAEIMATRPLESLKNAIRVTEVALRNQGWEKPCVVFLIDEFTYLYEYITEGVLTSMFMRQWKSMLEMQLFNAIVVGQDSMPLFKQAFSNEFGVTYDERITYLSDSEARRLAVEPILLEGQSRYRGSALDRLLALTAGNPFYMQIFCDRLVRHLNERKAPFITEADIEIVSNSLVAGTDALPIERFDPLITAAAESVAQAPRDAYFRILAEIAVQSNVSGSARPSDLTNVESKQSILVDMEQREVVEVDASGRISIRVKLFEQWLKSHADMMQRPENLK